VLPSALQATRSDRSSYC